MMLRPARLVIAILLLALFPGAFSQTIIPGGYVSGNWTSNSSPYLVHGNILVQPDSTLSIGEGTTILFSETSGLEVQGRLLVTGTPSYPVVFDREYDTISWRGIYFNTTDTSITDSSILVGGYLGHCGPNPGITISYSSRLRISDFSVYVCDAFRGAGINCSFSDPYFSGLAVHDNHALDGAGISLEGSSPVMKNCAITANIADGAGGGMVIFDGSNPVIENCFLPYNQSFGSGGGIYINDSAPVFRGCRFYRNTGAIGASNLYSGGGVSVKLQCQPVFENCSFEENTSHREGGGIASFSVIRLTGCLFSGNIAETWGGGAFLSSGNIITSPVINCTFTNNDAASGTALAMHNHEAVARNSIFWHEDPDNPNSIIFLDSQFSWNLLDVAYSDVQNAQSGIEDSGTTQYTWGPGNLNLDPSLDGDTGELTWQSPCIEAGTPDTLGLHLPGTDLAGNPRITNERIDIGAFEYQQPLIIQPPTFNIQHSIRVFPNPASEWVEIEFGFQVKNARFQIMNSDGLVIRQDAFSIDSQYRIDLQDVAAGVYFIVIKVDGETVATGKMIKI